MGKPIYTMPEEFLLDHEVPRKWKVFALINGFWINGLTVYASNEWFAEKLGCSVRNIKYALTECENDGLILRETFGRKRRILPAGIVETNVEGTGCSPVEGTGTVISGELGVHPPLSEFGLNKAVKMPKNAPNASSNASNKTLVETKVSTTSKGFVLGGSPLVAETAEQPRSDRRSADKLAVYHLFSKSEQPWWRHKQQREAALRLFDRGLEKVRRGVEIMRDPPHDFCPQANTPLEYEKKLPSLQRYVKKHGL